MTDLRKSVYVACGTLGIDANHMLWLLVSKLQIRELEVEHLESQITRLQHRVLSFLDWASSDAGDNSAVT